MVLCKDQRQSEQNGLGPQSQHPGLLVKAAMLSKSTEPGGLCSESVVTVEERVVPVGKAGLLSQVG